MRREEIVRACVEHVDFVGGFIMVPSTKNGRPRIVPLSPKARLALRKLIGRRETGLVFNMTGNAIRLRLQRMGIPSAHAWRRGWAVQALRNGVSETSVRAAAGWSSGQWWPVTPVHYLGSWPWRNSRSLGRTEDSNISAGLIISVYFFMGVLH